MWVYFIIPLLFIAIVSALSGAALKRQPKLAVAAAVFVFTLSAGLFLLLSSPEVSLLEAERKADMAAAQPVIDGLEAHLKNHPDDVRAWAKLGEKWMETGRYTASAEAYRHAVLLTEGNPAMILQYNKALIFAARGEVTDDAKRGLQMVLKLDAGNPEARYFLALRQVQDGDLKTAMQEMKSLYHELPEGSPLKEIIDRQIGRRP